MQRRRNAQNMEGVRLIPPVTLAFMAGVWLATRLEAGAWALWLVAIAAGFGLLAWRGRKPPIAALMTLALLAALSLTWARLAPDMPPAGRYSVSGTVYGEPTVRTEKRMSFELTNVTLDGAACSGRTYCTLYVEGDETLPLLFDGAQVTFEGNVYHPSEQENEYDFDFRLWLLRQDIAYGISGVAELQLHNTPETAPWTDVATRLRMACQGAFERVMGEDARLAMAMLLGERDGLRVEEQEAFRASGVAHVLTVSGLHVGLLIVLFAWLLRRLHLAPGVRLLAMTLFLAAYCYITGLSPASIRAAVMALLLLIARLLGRRPDPLTTLSTAALLLLVVQPLQLFSASFVLSFSAMAGILMLYRPILRRLQTWSDARRAERPARKRGAAKWLRERFGDLLELLSVSAAAQIGVMLPTACYFNTFPLYSILFNLVVVPFVGLLVPLYAITLAVSWIPAIGTLAGWLSACGTKCLQWLVDNGASLPYASLRVPSATVPIICALMASALALSQLVRAGRARRWLAVAAAVVLGLTGAYCTRPAELRYHQFAVGQGDASLVVAGGSTVAVDVGSYGTEVADRLLAEGRNLDALILTHLHLDHAQGVSELLAAGVTIQCAYLPAGAQEHLSEEIDAAVLLLRQANVPIRELAAGDRLDFGQASIQVLWPERGKWRDGVGLNDRSMALLIQLGEVRILNMADIGDGYEEYAAVACDVLKVGHHGSEDSTGEAFLQIAQPEVALISCKTGNARLPSAQALERLLDCGAEVYRTDETGEIQITVDGDGYLLKTWKAGNWSEP